MLVKRTKGVRERERREEKRRIEKQGEMFEEKTEREKI